MGKESSDVVRFDLGPLLQGQTRKPNLKVCITRLLLNLEVCNVEPTHRKSWVGNVLMSDLTLDPSFKVKRGQSNLKMVIFRNRQPLYLLLLLLQVCYVRGYTAGSQ